MNLPSTVSPVVAGPADFADGLTAQGATAVRVTWRPAPEPVVAALTQLVGNDDRYRVVQEANAEAIRRITAARCRLVDLRMASDVIPSLEQRMLLHAGPPLTWDTACGPMRGALAGAVLYEGWARSVDDAVTLLARGEIQLSPCQEHGAVGPMAGTISPSMPVFVVHNETFGNRAYATLNEGLGKVLRYGANDTSVIARLRWLAEEVAPTLQTAIRRSDGLDLTGLIVQALHMGDELHNRNKAATALFTRAIAPYLLEGDPRRPNGIKIASDILRYLAETDVFFLNLAMAASKAALEPAGRRLRGTRQPLRAGGIDQRAREPAGFEIDNPHLVSSGDTGTLAWITDAVEPANSEFRDDRFTAAFERKRGDPAVFTVAYVVRAVSPGTYVRPQAVVEDMYRPDRFGRTGSGKVEVTAAK